MRQTSKTPAGVILAGASRDSFGGSSHPSDTLTASRVQHLMTRYAMPIGPAAIVATLAFGGPA